MGINTQHDIDGLQQKEQALYQYIRELITQEFANTTWHKKEIYRNGLKIYTGKPKQDNSGCYVIYHNHEGQKIVITVDNMNVKRDAKSFIYTFKKGERDLPIDEKLIDSIMEDLQSQSGNGVKKEIIEAIS